MPTFSLSVQKITSQLYDAVGKNIYVSQRRIRLMQDFSQVWKQSIPAMRQNTMDVWMEGQSVWPGYSNKSYPAWKAKMGYSPDLNKRTEWIRQVDSPENCCRHFAADNRDDPAQGANFSVDRTGRRVSSRDHRTRKRLHQRHHAGAHEEGNPAAV